MAEAPKPGTPSEETIAPGATIAPTHVGTPEDYLEIKVEPQRAILTIKSAIANSGFHLTRDDVGKKLQGLKVISGVDWGAVDRMIAAKQYDRGQIIAQELAVKPGRDAVIQEKVKIDTDLAPVVNKAGKADYKNVDNIHQVKKGDVLAVKTPAVPGEPGQDIFGKALPATAAKDIAFKLGANTKVSEDGLNLVAAVSGYVYHNAGAICVGVTYVLKGNVDFHTGNLRYLGDIQVLGNVTEGFTVEADGNIVIEGTVEGSDVISHAGSIMIKSGVFGHSKGRIAAKSSIHLSSAQDIHVECPEGLVEVEKSLRNCLVLAMHLKADKPGCSVIGGEVRAYGEVSIANLGADGCQTHIRVLDRAAEEAKLRLKEIEHMMGQIVPKIEPLEKKLKNMKAMVARFGSGMSEKMRAELKAVVEVYAALKHAEKDFDEERIRMLAVMLATPKHAGKFAVTEKIVWGGILEMYGHPKELEAGDAKKEWLWSPTGLSSRSLLPVTPEAASPGPADLPLEAATPS